MATFGRLRIARLTVATETPAADATSSIVALFVRPLLLLLFVTIELLP